MAGCMSYHQMWQGPTLVRLVVGTVMLALLLVALARRSDPVCSAPEEHSTPIVITGMSHPCNCSALLEDDSDADDLWLATGTRALPLGPSPQGHPWLQVHLPVGILFLTRPQLLTRI
jgi:hypothetical protein